MTRLAGKKNDTPQVVSWIYVDVDKWNVHLKLTKKEAEFLVQTMEYNLTKTPNESEDYHRALLKAANKGLLQMEDN